MQSITNVNELLNESLQNAREIKTTLWFKNDRDMAEAEILMTPAGSQPEGAHTVCKTIGTVGMGALSFARCCPNSCPANFEAAVAFLAKSLNGWKPLIDSLMVKRAEEMKPLERFPQLECAVQALFCRVLNIDTSAVKGTSPEEFRQQQLEQWLLSMLPQGEAGVYRWNKVMQAVRVPPNHTQNLNFQNTNAKDLELKHIDLGQSLDFTGSDFSGASLERAELWSSTFDNVSFIKTDLERANLSYAKANATDFTDANMHGTTLGSAVLRNAVLKNADLAFANLNCADLRGVDLTVCKSLKDATFKLALYDEDTKLPDLFKHWRLMKWEGKGPDPYKAHVFRLADEISSVDLKGLVALLEAHVDEERLKKTMKMLKKEKFQLFSEVKEKNITGVVKSQTDKDLVYACSLASDGSFCCCTQNLKLCGGLKGLLCKHLLVLLIGLAKAEQLDPTAAASWALRSITAAKPKIDKEVMTNVFIKYKSMEAGEIDWRPTETIPEDYYAF